MTPPDRPKTAAPGRKLDFIPIVVVLTYGTALVYGREYVDILLRKHGAPGWTHIAVIIAVMVLWFGGGNLLIAGLRRPLRK